MSSRLAHALESDVIRLPEAGRIIVFGGGADETLRTLSPDRTDVVQPFFPDFRDVEAAGYRAVLAPPSEDYALALVRVPRSRDAARALVSAASIITTGPMLVDGAKTDGIESLLKEIRKRASVGALVSKAHGKLFSFEGGEFADWKASRGNVDGFCTAPGVFSADAIDRGSQLLAMALPHDLKGRVADLGAGWGFLSDQVLKSESVSHIDLIEADATALDCARENITDPRADFVWADAADFDSDEKYDVVVTNPPFHVGRRGDPGLGQTFIRSAARLLGPRGKLWLVANRHLPYERTLQDLFHVVEDRGGDSGFKIYLATRPRGTKRS